MITPSDDRFSDIRPYHDNEVQPALSVYAKTQILSVAC